jgi:hypothetical protein
MIPHTPGWSWELRSDAIWTAPPEGKGAGVIRYIERARPLTRIRDVVKTFERDGRFRVVRTSTPERIITREGEYGALVTVDGLLLEAPVQRTVATVFLDDFYSLIDGLALHADHYVRVADQVRNLALNDAHWLSPLRRRRFYYVPPAGWAGVAGLLHAFWFPQDHPANASKLTVLPAFPVPPGSPSFIDDVAKDQLAFGDSFALETNSEATPIVTAGRIPGSQWDGLGTAGGKVRYRDVHILEDGRFAYPLILESPPERRDENLVLLRKVTESIESLPQVGQAVTQASQKSMDYWVE